MRESSQEKLLSVAGYALIAGFVVVLAWTIFSQFLIGAVALRMTIYFAVLVGLGFEFVYGIGS